MTHYHVIAAVNTSTPVSSISYDSYEDSIESWVKLSTHFFGHLRDELGGMEIEKAKLATGNGTGTVEIARVGTNSLCFYWTLCEETCYSITWN